MQIINLKRFGRVPVGERLIRVKKSVNYINGEFKNRSETPVFSSDKSRIQVMSELMFRKRIRISPDEMLRVIKTDIRGLNPLQDVLLWFGHSSYFIQLNGKTFLIDPVFMDYASPFSFINKAFKGTDAYKSEEMPAIDYLIITHDHWDHLDYNTVCELKPKIRNVICSLGVGQHFEYWGFDSSIIKELDWFEGVELDEGWHITATPARHFSGRGFRRNKTLWVSFALQTPGYNIFIGGDGGYDSHYSEIGARFGPFDLAILEQGQYDENWSLIHLMPDRVFEAAKQLRARQILPVHNSKFALSSHPWDEPLNKITENHRDNTGIAVLTPRIGEPVCLNESTQTFTMWWKE